MKFTSNGVLLGMSSQYYFYFHVPLPRSFYRWAHRTSLSSLNMSSVRLFNVIAAATLILSSLLWTISAQDSCTSSSQANPIAQQYADAVTGTLNATLAVIPIPLDTARQLIPSQYDILEGAYRALLPDFPAGMYPVLMQAGLDHDIQLAVMSFTLPDFQVGTCISRKQLGTQNHRN